MHWNLQVSCGWWKMVQVYHILKDMWWSRLYVVVLLGGSVVSIRCSETYSVKTAQLSIWGIPLWYTSSSPRSIIQVTQLWYTSSSPHSIIQVSQLCSITLVTLTLKQHYAVNNNASTCNNRLRFLQRHLHTPLFMLCQPDVYPGQCWAMSGSTGYVVISLAATINVHEFSLEHIPKSLAPDGDIKSAPREFSVWVRTCWSSIHVCVLVVPAFALLSCNSLELYSKWMSLMLVCFSLLTCGLTGFAAFKRLSWGKLWKLHVQRIWKSNSVL